MVAVAQSIRDQLAWACRILAAEGYADLTLGHISARGPGGEVWIKRKGVALDEVEPDDVVSLDDTDAVLHLETVLHTGVYRAREGRRAQSSTAIPPTRPLSVRPQPISRSSPTTASCSPTASAGSTTPDLIVDDDQGDRVASALGRRRAVLMQNHGVLAVGKDVPWAVLTAITLERAARLQSIASTLGELRPMAPELALQLLPVKYRDEFVDEYWAAWQRQVARDGGGLGGARL